MYDKRMWGGFFVRTRCSDPAFRLIFVQAGCRLVTLTILPFRTRKPKREGPTNLWSDTISGRGKTEILGNTECKIF
jgi:hypothetical protein